MIRKLSRTCTLIACAALGFIPATPSRASDGGQFEDSDDQELGGHIDGSEETHLQIELTATPDAPNGSTGRAELEAENEHGVNAAVLEIEAEGLDVGTYTVSVTSVSDGVVTTLGSFEVAISDEDDDADDDRDDDGDDADEQGSVQTLRVASDDENDPEGADTNGEVEFGTEDGAPFPDGFNPFDIGLVTVADANGVVVLEGDFASVASIRAANFHANVQIIPGPAATSAKGRAVVNLHVRRHVQRQKFLLNAQGVPANAALTLKVNDNAVGTVRSNRRGKLMVKRLPKGTSARGIHSLSVEDTSGTNVLKAHF